MKFYLLLVIMDYDLTNCSVTVSVRTSFLKITLTVIFHKKSKDRTVLYLDKG